VAVVVDVVVGRESLRKRKTVVPSSDDLVYYHECCRYLALLVVHLSHHCDAVLTILNAINVVGASVPCLRFCVFVETLLLLFLLSPNLSEYRTLTVALQVLNYL